MNGFIFSTYYTIRTIHTCSRKYLENSNFSSKFISDLSSKSAFSDVVVEKLLMIDEIFLLDTDPDWEKVSEFWCIDPGLHRARVKWIF